MKKLNNTLVAFLSAFFLGGGIFSSADAAVKPLSLSEFLTEVQKKNKIFESYRLSREAAESKRLAGDLSLVPVLSLSGSYLSDKKQPSFTGATENLSTRYSLGFAKKFSSGTQFKVTGDIAEYTSRGIQNASFDALFGQYATGSLGVSLSQSLWKDAFGRGTSLRQKREQNTADLETLSLRFQEEALIAEAESSFWDHVYQKQELELRQTSLDRAKKIENWVTRRYRDGIGDRADLMNAKALSASRQMQLINANDDFRVTQKKIQDLLEIDNSTEVPELQGDLGGSRASLISEEKSRRVRMDAKLNLLEAKIRETGALETEENLKSDLVLAASYNTNSYEARGGISDATKGITKTDQPTSLISLTWSYLFDTDVKKAALAQAQKEALAAKLKGERRSLESQSSWGELQRRYVEMTKKIEAAQLIRDFQRERAKAEQDKLSKGRSITSQVILSEQEAADSELILTKLKAEQRKMEAQSRLFVTEENL